MTSEKVTTGASGRRTQGGPIASQKLILLVDDIPDHAKLYEAALRQRGYRVHVVNSGAAAKTIARSETPDCVVMDVRLPDMTGWELCRELKADPALEAVRIIVLTQDVTTRCAAESASSGCHAWLAQPTLAHDIAQAVDRVVAQPGDGPATSQDALLGVTACIACGSEQIRATLRVGTTQYYYCHACRLYWRVETDGGVA